MDLEAMAGEEIICLTSKSAEGFGFKDAKRRRLCGDPKVSDSNRPLCVPTTLAFHIGLFPPTFPLDAMDFSFDSLRKVNQLEIEVMRAQGDEPSWMGGDIGFHPEFTNTINLYLCEEPNVALVTAMYQFVWCEGPCTPPVTHSAKWYHINLNVELRLDDGTTSDKRYFVELISFFGTEFRVTACLPIEDQNLNVLTEISRKCEICDCSQIIHPRLEFCIPDVSLLNPYNFEEWVQ